MKSFLLTAVVLFGALASQAQASDASVEVKGPEVISFSVAKNLTRSTMPSDWSVGGCRRLSNLSVRCGVLTDEFERKTSSVKFIDGRFRVVVG